MLWRDLFFGGRDGVLGEIGVAIMGFAISEPCREPGKGQV